MVRESIEVRGVTTMTTPDTDTAIILRRRVVRRLKMKQFGLDQTFAQDVVQECLNEMECRGGRG